MTSTYNWAFQQVSSRTTSSNPPVQSRILLHPPSSAPNNVSGDTFRVSHPNNSLSMTSPTGTDPAATTSAALSASSDSWAFSRQPGSTALDGITFTIGPALQLHEVTDHIPAPCRNAYTNIFSVRSRHIQHAQASRPERTRAQIHPEALQDRSSNGRSHGKRATHSGTVLRGSDHIA